MKIVNKYAYVAVTLLLCGGVSLHAFGFSLKGPTLAVSDGDIRRGEWNSNVSAVMQQARETHVPALVIYAKRGCPHCARLTAAMTNATFMAWQKERNVLMATYGRKRPIVATDGTVKRRDSLRKEMTSSGVSAPVVCVYWLKEDGTEIKRIFSGTRGNMLGQKCEKLESELMQAVDSVIGDYRSGFSQTKNLQQKEGTK